MIRAVQKLIKDFKENIRVGEELYRFQCMRKRIAAHEVGHATIGLMLGIDVKKISIGIQTVDMLHAGLSSTYPTWGVCYAYWPPNYNAWNKTLYLLGGAAGEMLACGSVEWGCSRADAKAAFLIAEEAKQKMPPYAERSCISEASRCFINCPQKENAVVIDSAFYQAILMINRDFDWFEQTCQDLLDNGSVDL